MCLKITDHDVKRENKAGSNLCMKVSSNSVSHILGHGAVLSLHLLNFYMEFSRTQISWFEDQSGTDVSNTVGDLSPVSFE